LAFASKFEELTIWQDARLIVNLIYKETSKLSDFNFTNQIQRAAISIMNNIAEGFDRNNQREFKYFLRIAKAPAAEVKSMSYIAEDLQYLPKEKSESLRVILDELARKIGSLVRSIRLFLADH